MAASAKSRDGFTYEHLTDVWANYYVIPSALLNSADLKALGLSEYASSGKLLDTNALGGTFVVNDGGPIFIPTDSSLLFLFNNTSFNGQPAKITANSLTSEQFIQTSLPFGLPQYHYMVDLFLMAPRAQLNNTMPVLNTGDEWLSKLGFDIPQIPLSGEMLTENQPIVAFVFQSAQKLEDFEISAADAGDSFKHESYYIAKEQVSDALLSSSSEVAKAVIASSDNFFDNFARLWVSTLGSDALFSSLFCQVNSKVHELSYCLRINENGAEVSLIGRRPEPRKGRKSTQLAKRDLSFLHFDDDDCDDDDDDDNDDEDDDDDDCDGFDWLNVYDWKYEARMAAARQLNNMIGLIEHFVPDEFGDDDDDDDDCVGIFQSLRVHLQNEKPLQALRLKNPSQKAPKPSASSPQAAPIIKRAIIPSQLLRSKLRVSNMGYKIHDRFQLRKAPTLKSMQRNLTETAVQGNEDKDLDSDIDEAPTNDISNPSHPCIHGDCDDCDDCVADDPDLDGGDDDTEGDCEQDEDAPDEASYDKDYDECDPEFSSSTASFKQKRSADQKIDADCVEITWKRVFTHSLFGDPTNFCTQRN